MSAAPARLRVTRRLRVSKHRTQQLTIASSYAQPARAGHASEYGEDARGRWLAHARSTNAPAIQAIRNISRTEGIVQRLLLIVCWPLMSAIRSNQRLHGGRRIRPRDRITSLSYRNFNRKSRQGGSDNREHAESGYSHGQNKMPDGSRGATRQAAPRTIPR